MSEDFIIKGKAVVGTASNAIVHYVTTIPDVCPQCGKKVTGSKIEALGAGFHPECLICSACYQIIPENELVCESDLLLHKKCHKELYCERCAVCNDFIDENIAMHACDKAYHPECFRCTKCGDQKSVKINFVDVHHEPYCLDCFLKIKSMFPVCLTCNDPVLPSDSQISFFYKNKKYNIHSTCTECSICHQQVDRQSATILGGKLVCRKCDKESRTHICAECNEPIHGPYSVLEKIFWHQHHFKCSHCGEQLQSNVAVLDKGVLFCRKCYNEKLKTCPKCGRMDEGVDLVACGRLWHKKCFTCLNCRKDLSSSRYVNLNGRPLCKQCYIKMESQGKIDKWRRLVNENHDN